jgi:hypothetical protein
MIGMNECAVPAALAFLSLELDNTVFIHFIGCYIDESERNREARQSTWHEIVINL